MSLSQFHSNKSFKLKNILMAQSGVDHVEDGLCACIRNVETNGVRRGLSQIASEVCMLLHEIFVIQLSS